MGRAAAFQPVAHRARSGRIRRFISWPFARAIFPRNGWTVALAVIAVLSLLATFVQLLPYIPPKMIALVAGYGFHANYFHLPLIFVMASVLRPEDVRKFGWWILLLLIPMSMLLVAQFRRGAGRVCQSHSRRRRAK